VIPGLVSVVIAAYNAGRFIEETLTSVLSQSYPSVEVIVVDDGSTDDTREIVKTKYPSVTLVSQPNSGGGAAPRNHGARLAKGEFIGFFDADDIMLPQKLQRQCEWLKGNPKAAVTFTDYRNFNERGPWEHSHFETCAELLDLFQAAGLTEQGTLRSYDARRILASENFTITGSALLRTTVFKEVGGFDEKLQAGEDYDLFYRIALRFDIGVDREVGFLRRLHSTNVSNRVEHVLRHQIEGRKKIMALEPAPEIVKVHRKVLASYHVDAADLLARSNPGKARAHLGRAIRYGRLDAAVVKCSVKCMASMLGFRASVS
jgi:glycosyltransferase involved in cell wall biosynthesis